MMNAQQASSSLLQLTTLLNQFKRPNLFDSKFSKLLDSIKLAGEEIEKIKDSTSEAAIFNTIDNILDANISDQKWIDEKGVLKLSNLPIETTYGKGLPKFKITASDFSLINSSDSNLKFDVQLDAKSFVQDFTEPIFNKIDTVLKPFKKIDKALTTEIEPLEILKGSVPTTLKGLINEYGQGKDFGLITKIGDFTNLLKDIDKAKETASNIGLVPIGSFSFDTSGRILNSIPNPVNASDYLIKNGLNFISKAKETNFAFPILDNSENVFNLILGNENVDLLQFTLPKLGASIKYNQNLSIPIIPPISANIGFDAEASFNSPGIAFGFDSVGITDNPLNGFYIDGSKPLFIANARISGKAGAAVGVDPIKLAEAGGKLFIDGGIEFNISSGVKDPKKVRLENLDNISSSIKGKITAGAALYVEYVSPNPVKFLSALFSGDLDDIYEREEKTIAEFDIFDFNDDRTTPQSKPPNLSRIDGESLILNVGKDAEFRNIETNRTDEFFVVELGKVKAFGVSESRADFKEIIADAGVNNDTIDIRMDISARLNGGTGDDVLYGNNQSDKLYGDEDADQLIGRDGNDYLDGGDGKDRLYGDEGNDILLGGKDEDLLIGGKGNDILDGGSEDDKLYGDDGNDELKGMAGNDLLIGGLGEDTLRGGSGNDNLLGLEDDDLLYGDEGNDLLDGYGGNDTLRGGIGEDRLFGNIGDDILFGEAGDDELVGGTGDDQLSGNSGNDLLLGEAGDDLIDGDTEIDTVSYNNSPNGVVVNINEALDYQNPSGIFYTSIVIPRIISTDIEPNFSISAGIARDGFGTVDTLRNLENIIGSGFDDILVGNRLDNRIEGLAGNDLLISTNGNDYLDGGEGNDTISYRRDPNRVIVNLEKNQALEGFGGTDLIYNIENVIGSDFNDEVIGDIQANNIYAGKDNDIINARDGNDIIFGEAGKDTLFGENGDDYLVGGMDADVLNGGDGSDTASYITSTAGISASLITNTGAFADAQGDRFISIENLEGSNYDDFLYGDDGNNILSGLGGNDVIRGEGGDDQIDGGTGDNVIFAGAGNNTIAAADGRNAVYAESGNDSITLGNGNNTVFAANGNNSIAIGDGNNSVNAGSGDDSIILGNGKNTVFAGDGKNTVNAGFGDDTIYGGSLADIIYAGAGDNIVFAREGQNTVVTGDGKDTIYSGSGRDFIASSGGDDTIFAGAGNNWINAGTGNNTIYSGNDQDLFILSVGAGLDTIKNFEVGKDKLGLTGGLQVDQLLISQINGGGFFGTQIGIRGSDEILARLEFTQSSQLNSTSFRTDLPSDNSSLLSLFG
jgi:Ca2+-binding RTX toxin-like protein